MGSRLGAHLAKGQGFRVWGLRMKRRAHKSVAGLPNEGLRLQGCRTKVWILGFKVRVREREREYERARESMKEQERV